MIGKNARHIDRFYLLVISSYALTNSKTGDQTKELRAKVIKFYTTEGLNTDEDKKDVEFTVNNYQTELFHFLVVETSVYFKEAEEHENYDRGNCPMKVSEMNICAAASVYANQYDGAFVSWICVDRTHKLPMDRKFFSFRMKGLGTSLMDIIQRYLGQGTFNNILWAQIPLGPRRPEEWYRTRLFFLPVLPNAKVPMVVKNNLLTSNANTVFEIYHSTGLIREANQQFVLPQNTTLDTIFSYANDFLLGSYGMPKRVRVKGNLTEECMRQVRDMLEMFEGETISLGKGDIGHSIPRSETQASRETLQALLNKVTNTTRTRGYEAPYLRISDLGKGNQKFVVERLRHIERTEEVGIRHLENDPESSESYQVLSKGFFGVKTYYSRLRLACAHILLQISFLPEDHEIFHRNSAFMSALSYITQQEGPSKDSKDHYDRSDNQTARVVKQYAYNVMHFRTTMALPELLILCNLYPFNLGTIKGELEDRHWQVGLTWPCRPLPLTLDIRGVTGNKWSLISQDQHFVLVVEKILLITYFTGVMLFTKKNHTTLKTIPTL
jgi:hypothetical protein